MAVTILRRGAPGLNSSETACRKSIANGATGRRYRIAYRRAERYARLLRIARRMAILFFALTQAIWPVRQFFGNLSYEIMGISLRSREKIWAGGATRGGEAAKAPVRAVNWHLIYVRVNTALIFLACGIAFFTLSIYRVGLEVFLDGKSIGYVASQKVAEDSLVLVADTASDILGHPYTPSYNVKYQFSIVNRNAIFDRGKTVVSLLEQIPEIGWMYVLRVDGEIVGAMENKAEIDLLLDEILNSHQTRYVGKDFRIVNDISIERRQASRELLASSNEIRKILTSERSGETVYAVREGESVLSIAEAFGLSESTLREINYTVDFSALKAGQKLLVKRAKPFLSIVYERSENHIETIPYQTQYLEDNSLWLGETTVLVEGRSGEERIYTTQTVLDGYAQSPDVTRRETISVSSDRVIAVGTKTRAATGTFIRPSSGYVSSNYGPRILFGKREFHKGIDYASPIGTPIVASDGGVVVQANVVSGYGLIIVVDHGGGFSTAYAHCSKLVAQVGQTVGQGELIALVGNTGRSTGPHVHFEIRVNGVQQNPANYLR